MSALDIRTVFFICIGFLYIYGIGMIIFARKVSATFNGIYLFAIANFSIASGFTLVSFMGHIDIFWSIIVANSLILLCSMLIYYGHLQFIGDKNKPIILSAFLLITAIGLHVFFTYVFPNANNRIIVTSIYNCLVFLLTARAVYRIQRQNKQHNYTALIVIAIILAVFFAVRIEVTSLTGPINPYNFLTTTIPFHAMAMIVVLLYIVALNFLIILIATQILTQKLTDLAHKDSLTLLYNRRGLDYVLDNNNIFSRPLAAILCDIDFFKSINDSYGHCVGDIVIQALARLITESTRKTDICVRWGGEEFLIILPLINAQQAYTVAEKIRTACEQETFPEQPGLSFTSSFGIFENIEGYSFDKLVHNADQALYQAKYRGRNQVCIFNALVV